MSIPHRRAVLAVLALGLSVAPHASAALWSSTNTVAGISETASMEVSLTGDQITVAAQVDSVMPAGITNVVTTALNGASCSYNSTSRVVRVVVFDWMLNPLPLWPRPMCTIQYRVSRSTSTWFPMRGAECVTVDGVALPASQCALDEGYLTVRR